MSSSEQAPEPTMDEILASIRKIIADDEQEAAQHGEGRAEPPSGAEPADASFEVSETGVAYDIETALGQPGETALGQPGEAGAPDEDIFDLTNEVTPAEPEVPEWQAPEPEPAAQARGEAADPLQDLHPQAFEPSAPQDAEFPEEDEEPARQPAPAARADAFAPSAAPQTGGYGDDVLAGAPMEEASLTDDVSGFGADAPAGAPFAREEPAAHPERAPGPEDLSFGRGLEAAPGAPAEDLEPDAPPESGPSDPWSRDQAFEPAEAAPAFEPAEAAPARPTRDAGMFPREPLPPMDASFEVSEPEEAVARRDAVEDGFQPVAGMPATDFGEAETGAEPQPGHGEVKSLEDSVKEMLRPLLRSWLDENMPRILEGAVREELKSSNTQN